MDNTTTTPDSASDASIEAALLAQAQAHDAGKPVDTTPAPDQQATPAPDTTQSGNAPAATNPDQTPTTQPTATPPTAPQSPYQTKRTEQQRREDSWKKLQEDKEKFRAEREQFYREQAQRAQSGSATPPPTPTAAEPLAEFSPEQLEAAAEKFDKQGQFDLAEEARAAAKAKRERPAAPAAPATQPGQPPAEQSAAFAAAQAEWKANLAAAEKADPELTDPNSPLRKEVVDTLNSYQILRQYPQGITHAVEIVKMRREALAAGELRKQVAALEARLKAAEAQVLPAVGSPEGGIAPRGLADMSDADAERELLRMAAEQGPIS